MATAPAKKTAAATAKAAAAEKAVAAGQGTLYNVLSNLDHDGKRYAPGEPIALDDVAAEPLLAAGVVAAAEAAK